MKYQDERKEEIYNWFHERFTIPEQCDTDVEISGYQYSCGGPYFAREIIPSEFTGRFPALLINEVVADLETECPEWALRKAA